MTQKRILTIQDISCFGKCSLAAALPIISSTGIECTVLPTCVLSTHTAYPNPVITDMSEFMKNTLFQWKSLNIKFDSFLTGYLANISQIEYVMDFYRNLKKENSLLFVDPVMGDHLKLYKGFNTDFVVNMKKLCSNADVVMPNITEALFLLGSDMTGSLKITQIYDIAKKLCDLGCKKAVITGVISEDNHQGAIMYDSTKDEFISCFDENHPKNFYGTGDIFSSVLSSLLTLGFNNFDALNTSVKFTSQCIRNTIKSNRELDNIEFESSLYSLTNTVNTYKKKI